MLRGAVVAVGAASLLWVTPAFACTTGIHLDLVEPGDGATGVPTNVVPWFRGALGSPSVETGTPPPEDGGVSGMVVTLVDDGGVEVTVDAVVLSRGHFGVSVELRPQGELRPDTSYTVLAYAGGSSEQWTFTTGSGPLDATPPSLGDLSMEVSNNSIDNSCDVSTIACVGLPSVTTLRATITSGGATEAETLFRAGEVFEHRRSESSRSAPFCIELRARNVAGQLGPPSTVCSSAARTFDVTTTELSPSCMGGRPHWGGTLAEDLEPESDGCTATSAHHGPWPLALALLLVGFARSRRQ